MWNTVFEALLPVLLIILLGAGLRHIRFLSKDCFEGLNRLAFWVGLPCLLFIEISSARVSGGEALRISLAIMVTSLLMLLLAYGIGRALHLKSPSLRVFNQGVFRGNLVYVGLPVIFFALPPDADMRATAILALAPTIPFFNGLGVLLLMRPEPGKRGKWFVSMLGGMARNPLIIACVLGMVALLLKIQLPTALHRAVEGVGRIGLPAALLALGASLTWERVRGHGVIAFLGALLKVAVGPLVGFFVARACGLDGLMLTVCLLYIATPTAVASYVMADQMGADSELAAAIIVVGTILAFPALAGVLLLFG